MLQSPFFMVWPMQIPIAEKVRVLTLSETAELMKVSEDDLFKARQAWIDSGWHEHTEGVYLFCAAINRKLGIPKGQELYRPTKGYGEGQRNVTVRSTCTMGNFLPDCASSSDCSAISGHFLTALNRMMITDSSN